MTKQNLKDMHFHNNKTHIQTPEMRQTTPDVTCQKPPNHFYDGS